jgi:hypothetical protein
MLNPCFLQLIPKKPVDGDRIFFDVADFATRSPLICSLAEGETREDVEANAVDCAAQALGEEFFDDFALYGSPIQVKPEWDRCYLVEDWGARTSGMNSFDVRPVMRAVVYAPSAELAAWSARTEFAARRKQINLWIANCRFIGVRSALPNEIRYLPPPTLGEITTVHDFTGADGALVSRIPWFLQLGAFRRVQAEAVAELKGRAKAAFNRGVQRKLQIGIDRDQLLAMVRLPDTRAKLEEDEASNTDIAIAAHIEDVCNSMLAEITASSVAEGNTETFPFLPPLHAHLSVKVSENMVVFGSVQPARQADLERTIEDDDPVVLYHDGKACNE